MKIAHITDIHVNDFMSDSNKRVSIENLKRIFEDVKKKKINKIILTGDYGNPENFDEIVHEIKNFNLEYEFILGNHDELENFKRRKELYGKIKDNGIYYNLNIENILFIFLDTRLSYLDEKQLEYIDTLLKRETNGRIIIFSHHPVLDCGNTILDKLYPLKNRNVLAEKLKKLENEIFIFSGHYHNNYNIVDKNIKQFVTMSVYCQLKKYSEKVELESYDFGYRVINIGDKIETELIEFK